MAYNQHARSGGAAAVITQQPKQAGNNPFYDYHQQWTAGLGDCFNDMGQCISNNSSKYNPISHILFLGCYAYFCWCCFMSSLAKSINEPATGCCFGNGILGAYRMKVRTVFKIQVNLNILSVCFSILFCYLIKRVIHTMMHVLYAVVRSALVFNYVMN